MTGMDERELLAGTLRSVAAGHALAPGRLRAFSSTDTPGPGALWRELAELELTLVAVPEESGGSGGVLADAAALAGAIGASAAPIPLVENVIAARLLADAGMPLPDGPLTIAPDGSRLVAAESDRGISVRGALDSVPWGRSATHVVVVADVQGAPHVLSLPIDRVVVTPGHNFAGEPRDDLECDLVLPVNQTCPAGPGTHADSVLWLGALLRSASMAGAMERVLELAITYVRQREQFGRPLARLQVVQHMVAELAGEVVATSTAVAGAVAAASRTQHDALWAIGLGKARAGKAAGRVSALAHQLHGAIGFTDEHELHLLTTRLWSWRDDFGSEHFWAEVVGRDALGLPAGSLWPSLVSAV
jgi:acyl-CoA dehydrogenase